MAYWENLNEKNPFSVFLSVRIKKHIVNFEQLSGFIRSKSGSVTICTIKKQTNCNLFIFVLSEDKIKCCLALTSVLLSTHFSVA